MTSLKSRIINLIAPIYPQAKRWLHRFNGGVFPSYNKELSSRQPIRDNFIPERLIIPLQQQVGLPAEMLVSVGDKVKKNQLIARSSKDASKALVVPIHAPTSGVIESIENQTLPHPSGLNDIAVVIKTDQLDETIDNFLQVSGEPPQTPTELKAVLQQAGIIGMGGAGFPTYAKLPKKQGQIHTLLINGAECEPFITCDDLLMQHEAKHIIQGAIITANALGAKKVICGIEANKPSALQAMQHAAQNSIVKVVEVQSVYPMGGQKQLTQELTGIEVPKKAHAVDIGLLMMNVATYAAIYHAVKEGNPLTSRLVSVTGLGLAQPFNIRALIGTPFEELVKLAKPKSEINYPLVMGGPMMGFAVQNNQVPVIKTTNCILANPPEPSEMQMPCIRCGECMDACPVNLLPQQMYWHSHAKEFDKVEKLNVFDCIECGCCSYVCPSHIPLVQYYRNAKSEIKEIHAEEKAVELAKQRHDFKMARIEREKQEREARLKAKKEAVKKQAKANTEATTKPKTGGAASAAAAAKAAAAKRAAAKKASPSSGNTISPARKKAIDAAKKAASQATQTETTENQPSAQEVAKKAAMAAAKKRAKAKQSQTEQAEQLVNSTSETSGTAKKDPRQAAKAAAMAAAKKRAQASKTKQAEDLTQQTESTEASNKEAARKAAMQAARAAAKKRKQASVTPQKAEETIETTTSKSDEKTVTNKPAETSVEDKKQRAMRLAREAAAKRAANKKQAQPTHSENEEND